MVRKLYKLAQMSERLREAHLEKVALLGAAVKGIAKLTVKHPVLATAGGMSAVSAPGMYRQNKSGFEAAHSIKGETPKAL